MYQILSELAGFCRRYDKNNLVFFFSSQVYIHCLKKVPTFKLSVTLPNFKIFKIFLLLESVWNLLQFPCDTTRLTLGMPFAKSFRSVRSSEVGDFSFWISLSLSLFAQSKIRTERKLNQKVKSIFWSDSVRTSDWTSDWAKDWANRLVWSSDWVQS